MKIFKSSWILLLGWFGVASGDAFEDTITFNLFCQSYQSGVRLSKKAFNEHCDSNGNLTVVTHGWSENYEKSPWIKDVIGNFLQLRGNCLVYMEYSKYSSGAYFSLTPYFPKLSALLKKKLSKLGNPSKTEMFGFSFGARLVMDVGYDLAEQGRKIGKIYACDPAGPGFVGYKKDPKKAAKYVECINTSIDKGTMIYDCHRNWRLGVCGKSQVAASSPPYGSHGLCPYFFNQSFSVDFTPNNLNKCSSKRMMLDAPSDLIMGPRETRTSPSGDIFSATGKEEPWNIVKKPN